MNILDLPEDCIYEINKYLCYVDQMALKFSLCHNVKLDFISILNKKLSEHVKDVDKFIDELIKNKAIISGSFILACLYDNNNYNDIDIYEYNKSDNYYYSNHYKPFDEMSKMQQYYYNQGYKWNSIKSIKSESKFCGVIGRVRNFNYLDNNISIQNILVNCNIMKFIDNSFDIEICKNIFNGTLMVKSWDNLFKRSSHIIPTWVLMVGNQYYCNDIKIFKKLIMYDDSCDISITKYHDKNILKNKLLKELEEKHIYRGNKYIERGYNIYKHKNYYEIYDIFIDNLISIFWESNNDDYKGAYTIFINSSLYTKYLNLLT